MGTLGKLRRLEVIKAELPRGKNQSEIAEICGVSRKTINQDIQEWRESGGFEDWLEQEFYRLHNSPDVDDKTKYQVVAKLREKTIVQKTRFEGSAESPIVIKMYQPEKKEE